MSNKIIVAKPGYNALLETNPDNIVYSSDYDTLKYYVSGSVNLDVAGADVETTVTHGLGYIPFFIVYFKHPIFTTRYSMTPFAFEDVGVYAYLSAYADNDKLYFTAHANTLTATITFLYKIFRNNTGL